jgi:hypothetical protein
MLSRHLVLATVIVAICARGALSQDINWLLASTPTENRPRFREDAHLFRISLNRLALFGGLTGKGSWEGGSEVGGEGGALVYNCAGDSGCSNAVDLWTLSVDDKSKAFTWASISSDTGLPSNLTGDNSVAHLCFAAPPTRLRKSVCSVACAFQVRLQQ